jgi:hypothetical protein
MRGIARTAVIAGTATAVSGRVARRQNNKWASQEQQAAQAQPQYAEPQYAPPPPQQYAQPEPPAPQFDPIDQLTKLAALKEQGILTESEFAVQKAKILGS